MILNQSSASGKQLPAIQAVGLSKTYGRSPKAAVEPMCLEVYQGEIFGFLGPNGAGKTTTIKMLLDLIKPTSGQAVILGYDCQKSSVKSREKVGYIPGELRLYPNYSGNKIADLIMSTKLEPVSSEYVSYLCEKLNVEMDTPTARLSLGNRQKIGLVLALMAKPSLLILDEPTLGLDPIIQNQVLELLREVKDDGRTVFLSSHVLPEVEQICDRIGIIRNGHLVAVEEIQAMQKKLLKHLRVTFSESVDSRVFDALPNAKVTESTDKTLSITISGNIDQVIKLISKYKVESLESGQPSLENVFMSYYQDNLKEFV